MALSDLQIRKVEKAATEFLKKKRPPPDIRHKIDLGYRIEGQNVFVFEIFPLFNNPSKKIETPSAKGIYVKVQDHWKVYWMRGNLKWDRFGPVPTVNTISDFFELVDEDKHGCFFG